MKSASTISSSAVLENEGSESDLDPKDYLDALRAPPAVNLSDDIWRDDALLRRAFSWLTRIGVAPKFGTIPIHYYQQEQMQALDRITELAKQKGISLKAVRCKNGYFEGYDIAAGRWKRFAQKWLGRVERINESDEPDAKELLLGLQTNQRLTSETHPGDEFTVPTRVVLRPSHSEGEWVTRLQNANNGSEFWGHYFRNYREALADFEERCIKLGVSTTPVKAEKVIESDADQTDADQTDADEIKDYLDELIPSDLNRTVTWLEKIGFKKFYSYGNLGLTMVRGFTLADVTLNRDGTFNLSLDYHAKPFLGLSAQELFAKLRNAGMVPGNQMESAEPDDIDPRDYLQSVPLPDRRIRISYARTTPESSANGDTSETGWIDEDGVSMNPDDWDIEDGVRAVDKAVDFLRREGATQPSSSHFHPGVWYSTGYTVVDYTTNEDEERCFHLSGFDPKEEQEIFNEMRQRRWY